MVVVSVGLITAIASLWATCSFSPPSGVHFQKITLPAGVVELNYESFRNIDLDAGFVFSARIRKTLDHLVATHSFAIPERWEMQRPGKYPVDLETTVYVRSPSIEFVLLPPPPMVDMHVPLPEVGADVAELASQTSRSSVSVIFDSSSTDESMPLWMPTPDGFPSPLPGVNLHAKPWLDLGRIVVCNPSPDPRQSLELRTSSIVRKLGLDVQKYIYAIPQNDVLSKVILTNADSVYECAWHAFVVADGVGGVRTSGVDDGDAAKRMRYTVPFTTFGPDQTLKDGYQLLRIPYANRYRDRGFVPGERIAIDSKTIDAGPGYVAVLNRSSLDPAAPDLLLETNLQKISDAVNEGRLWRVAIVSTISQDDLEALFRSIFLQE